jgi:uncharacterized membrane protein
LGGILTMLGVIGIIGAVVLFFLGNVNIQVMIIIEVVSLGVATAAIIISKLKTKTPTPEEEEEVKKKIEQIQTMKSSGVFSKNNAVGVLQIYGGLNIIIGILSMIFQIQVLRDMGIGVIQLIVGVVLLILGYFIGKNSLIALFAAIVIILGNVASLIYSYFGTGTSINNNLFGVVLAGIVHIYILSVLFSAIKNIQRIKKERGNTPPDITS